MAKTSIRGTSSVCMITMCQPRLSVCSDSPVHEREWIAELLDTLII